MLDEIKQAYKALEDAQSRGDDVAATEAYARLGELIQEADAISALPVISDLPAIESDKPKSIASQRDEVMSALYDAATSGNVPAALKWIELHKDVREEPDVDAEIVEPETSKKRRRKSKPKRPKKRREQKITLREGRFIEFYFGESAYNGTDAARKAGYAGNDNVLAVTAHQILRRPKIRQLIEARINQIAMPLEQVFKLLGEQARGSVEFFLDGEPDETPAFSLKRARDEGKLHLVKNITFYPESEGGGVKHLALYSALEAGKAIGNLHRLIQPRKPKTEAGDSPEESARTYEQDREAALAVINKLKATFSISTAEAAKRAVKFFPAAKEWLDAADQPEPTTAVN